MLWTGKTGSIKAQLRQANKKGAEKVIILGEDELDKKVVKLKDMVKGEEKEVSWEKLPELLLSS